MRDAGTIAGYSFAHRIVLGCAPEFILQYVAVRRCLALLLCSAVAVSAGVAVDAGAATLGDGADFALTLRDDALLCVRGGGLEKTAPACSELPRPDEVSLPAREARYIAVGAVQVPDGESLATASMTLMKLVGANPGDPGKDEAESTARQLAEDMAREIRPAHVRGGSLDSQLWSVHGATLVRFSFDLDDVPAGNEMMQHTVGFAAYAIDGIYMCTFSTRAPHSDAIEALVSETMQSVEVQRAASPSSQYSQAYQLGYYGSRVVLYALVAAAVGTVFVLARRKARRDGPKREE
jgi:hypothetical protein